MIDYRSIEQRDVPRLLNLWLTCFPEKEEAAKLFFERNLSFTHGYLAADGNRIVAALYLVDCSLCGLPAHYLCGAATMPDYRRRGIMTALIGSALADAAYRGDCYSVLLPADDGLYSYYAGLGYIPNGVECVREFTTGESFSVQGGSEKSDLLQMQQCHKDKFLYWNKNYIEFAADYYACYGVKSVQNGLCFALYEQDGERAEVLYAIYNDFNELKKLLNRQGVLSFSLAGSPGNPLFHDCRQQTCGMVRSLRTGLAEPDSVYIGLTLS